MENYLKCMNFSDIFFISNITLPSSFFSFLFFLFLSIHIILLPSFNILFLMYINHEIFALQLIIEVYKLFLITSFTNNFSYSFTIKVIKVSMKGIKRKYKQSFHFIECYCEVMQSISKVIFLELYV